MRSAAANRMDGAPAWVQQQAVRSLVHLWRQHRQLARAQFFAYQREPEDAALEAVGEARKQRRFLLIFEQVELADDEVTLLAGLDKFAEARMVVAKAAAGTDGLGIHPSDEQGIVANVLADGAL